MGEAEDWQTKLTDDLKDIDCLILNPRRDDWDSSWKQTKDNPQFRQQVTWELRAQEQASILVYYFAEQSKAPITFLELGLFGHKPYTLVFCPKGFYRKGNVDITCERYGIPVCETYVKLLSQLKFRIAVLQS